MSRNNDGDLILIVVFAFLYVFTKNIFQNKLMFYLINRIIQCDLMKLRLLRVCLIYDHYIQKFDGYSHQLQQL